MKLFSIALITIISISLSSCGISGQEIGRVPFKGHSNTDFKEGEITLNLKKDEVVNAWVDADLDYEGNLQLYYSIDVLVNDKPAGSVNLNALETNPTMMEAKSSFGNSTSWSYFGKMNYLTATDSGKYTFKINLHANEIEKLTVAKADFVLKK